MSHRNHQKKRSLLKKLLTVLICIVAVILLFYFFIWQPVKKKAVQAVETKLIESELSSSGITVNGQSAEDIINGMSSKDKETLNTIISNHTDPSTVSKAVSLYQSRDKKELETYAKEQLSTKEQEQLSDLYSKYISSGQ